MSLCVRRKGFVSCARLRNRVDFELTSVSLDPISKAFGNPPTRARRNHGKDGRRKTTPESESASKVVGEEEAKARCAETKTRTRNG